jgi:hypothetical protein
MTGRNALLPGLLLVTAAASCSSRRAADYGVADTTMAAVVVRNTSAFRITTIDVANSGDARLVYSGTSPDGHHGAVAVPPGRYSIAIAFEGGEQGSYVARGVVRDSTEFAVAAGKAYVLRVQGGDAFVSSGSGTPRFASPGIVHQSRFELMVVLLGGTFVAAMVAGAVGHRWRTGHW